MKRRTFLGTTAFGLAKLAAQSSVPDAIKNLRPMTAGVQPITNDERRARIEKARRLMRENKLGAIVMEGGSSQFYFTGERLTGYYWALPAAGEPAWIGPPSPVSSPSHLTEVRTWSGDGEYKTLAQFLKERGAGTVGIEERTRFAVFEGLRTEAPSLELA